MRSLGEICQLSVIRPYEVTRSSSTQDLVDDRGRGSQNLFSTSVAISREVVSIFCRDLERHIGSGLKPYFAADQEVSPFFEDPQRNFVEASIRPSARAPVQTPRRFTVIRVVLSCDEFQSFVKPGLRQREQIIHPISILGFIHANIGQSSRTELRGQDRWR